VLVLIRPDGVPPSRRRVRHGISPGGRGGSVQAAALISIYPTVVFLAWSRSLKTGSAPEISPERVRSVRLCLMLELTLILVILLCAALMARGFGYLR